MREITPSLFVTEYQDPGFFKAFHSNAFFLKRPSGENFVIYNSPHLEFDEFLMRDMGGVARQYISHDHELDRTCEWLQNTFSSQFYCHDLDEGKSNEFCSVSGTFNSEIQVTPDFKIIPIAGHTPGSTCFYWISPEGQRVMFTGDILVPDARKEWMLFMDDQSSQNEALMLEGLNKLYDYPVDLVIPRGSEGPIEWMWSPREEWQDLIDKAIVRLRTKLLHISKRI